MDNRNGFTLVELLAVIVILSVLMTIAIPRIIKMMTSSKVDAFKTEAESLLKTAQQEYAKDSLNGTLISAYCKDVETVTLTSNNVKTLEYLDNQKDLKYRIEFDKDGNITKYILKNSTYGINLTENIITTETIDKLSRSDIQTPSETTLNCP